MRARVIQDGPDRILSVERFDLRLLGACERDVAIERQAILGREVGLHHVDREELAVTRSPPSPGPGEGG